MADGRSRPEERGVGGDAGYQTRKGDGQAVASGSDAATEMETTRQRDYQRCCDG